MIGHTEAVKTLVKMGAKLNATDNELRTPLHFCAANCNRSKKIYVY